MKLVVFLTEKGEKPASFFDCSTGGHTVEQSGTDGPKVHRHDEWNAFDRVSLSGVTMKSMRYGCCDRLHSLPALLQLQFLGAAICIA